LGRKPVPTNNEPVGAFRPPTGSRRLNPVGTCKFSAVAATVVLAAVPREIAVPDVMTGPLV
jgi:hypothetical protein